VRTLTTAQRRTAGAIAAGALGIAGIGFAGSYTAVRALALAKGFGWFATVLPVGVDAGIVVLLALDLLLTWLRIPFPLLRHTAWLLTAATIAFNGAAAWPDPLGVSMHAVIPALFIIVAEAGRHAVGRVADITADRHMEPVRLARWLLAPASTFRLWRRMKLWELRSYDEVIRREQDRLIYRARLRARYGIAWRLNAPVEAVMPLRLARHGLPVAETVGEPGPSDDRRQVVICQGPHGIRIRRLKPRPAIAPTEPAGSVGDRIDDVESLFGAVHAPVVYFIENGNRIKIGTSTNLRKRVAALSLSTRSIVLVLHGGVSYERELHARFAAYRTPGTEWFDYAEPLVNFVVSGGSATEAPTRSATGADSERSQSATTTAAETLPAEPMERRESATETPVKALPERSGAAIEAPAPAPRKRPAKRSKSSDRDTAQSAIEALYEVLGRRPTEAEMVAELKRVKAKFTSPAFAKKLRAEIEKDKPALAALGTDNVRPLTG
jgi:hypothetical protein